MSLTGELSAVLVTHQSARHLEQAVASLRRWLGGISIIIIDNGSWDGTVAQAGALPGPVDVVALERNAGFAAAARLGVARGRGRYVLLLNPDAELLDDGARGALARLEADRRLAALAPLLVDDQGHPVWSAGPRPTLARIALRRHRLLRDERGAIGTLTGSALLFRRCAWDDVGGLDPGYFLYYEDADLCRRWTRRGWRLGRDLDWRVRHEGGASFDDDARRHARLVQGRERYIEGEAGAVPRLLWQLWLRADLALRRRRYRWMGRARKYRRLEAEALALAHPLPSAGPPPRERPSVRGPAALGVRRSGLPQAAPPAAKPRRRTSGLMAPDITVVMPSFQHERFLGQAVASVRAQEGVDWELVIVDDGSTDGTSALLDALEGAPRLRILRGPHRGIGACFNRGLEAARGRYLTVCPSDDRLSPGQLARAVGALKRSGARWCAAPVRLIDAAGQPHPDEDRIVRQILWGPLPAGGHVLGDLVRRQGLALSGVVAERELVLSAGGFHEAYEALQDYDLWLRIALEHPLLVLDESAGQVRWHGANHSRPDAARSERFRVERVLALSRAWACARTLPLDPAQIELLRAAYARRLGRLLTHLRRAGAPCLGGLEAELGRLGPRHLGARLRALIARLRAPGPAADLILTGLLPPLPDG